MASSSAGVKGLRRAGADPGTRATRPTSAIRRAAAQPGWLTESNRRPCVREPKRSGRSLTRVSSISRSSRTTGASRRSTRTPSGAIRSSSGCTW